MPSMHSRWIRGLAPVAVVLVLLAAGLAASGQAR